MATQLTRRDRARALRTIGAIAGKDIVDGLRNRSTLLMMVGVTMIMLAAGALPLLLDLSGTQRLLLVDDAQSPALARALRSQDLVRPGSAADADQLREMIGEASDAVVGVVLPFDWPAAPAGETIIAPAYLPYWVSGEEGAHALTMATGALEAALGQPVRLERQSAYPGPSPGGNPLMLSMSFVMILFLVSCMLVPLLLIEERENHTFEMLLVSPASYSELVLGKALAGLTYGLLAAAVYLLFNNAYIVHWHVVALAVLSGAFFATCLGLLLGLLFDNQGTLNLWMGLVLILLLAPMLLGLLPSVPDALLAVAEWMPTTGLLRLFSLSLTQTPSGSDLARHLLPLFLGAGLLLVLIQWRLRRSDL